MGSEVTVSGREMIRDLLVKNENEFARALQNNINPGQFTRIALTTIQGSPELLECTPWSLYTALLQAAQLSLNLDGLLGQAYLVPYRQTAVMIIGYKGLRELALRTNKYRDIRARVVYHNDIFKISLGSDEFIKHEPFEGDRGEKRGCYAIAEMLDGSTVFEFMFGKEINKHKQQYSKAWKRADSIWQTAESVAWEKTLIRRLCGRLQMSVKAQHVMALEDRMNAGLEIPKGDIEGFIDLGVDPDKPKNKKSKNNLQEALDRGTSEQDKEERRGNRDQTCAEIEAYLLKEFPDMQEQSEVWDKMVDDIKGPDGATYEDLSHQQLMDILDLIRKKVGG